MNERVSWQVCASCGQELAASDPRQRCPACRGLLELRHRAPPMTHGGLRALLDSRLGVRRGPLASGVWRYRELVLPEADDSLVSYPEGNTPLLARPAVAAWAGVPELLLKHEGHNPTGSFKDRGMTVGVTQARRVRATAVACASTGNTGASLAAYAALAGSQPAPEASTTAFASRISASLTASTTPSVSLIACTARSYEAGFPMLIAVAMVCACTR